MKTITLLPGSRNAVVHEATPEQTTIHYTNPAWPTKTSIYQLPGEWKIESQKANVITLKPAFLNPYSLPDQLKTE